MCVVEVWGWVQYSHVRQKLCTATSLYSQQLQLLNHMYINILVYQLPSPLEMTEQIVVMGARH